jgi:DinB superfamily
MEFSFELGMPVLERTPAVLQTLLEGLPPAWTESRDGPDTWSPFDVVGHLIHGERTDWVPRIEHVLAHGDTVPFPVFDRVAMFEASRGRTLAELLATFAELRAASLDRLRSLRLTSADFGRRGLHPGLGVVTLGQHLATWVAHDLSHIAQIVRVMGRQYGVAVGPWKAYLPMLGSA